MTPRSRRECPFAQEPSRCACIDRLELPQTEQFHCTLRRSPALPRCGVFLVSSRNPCDMETLVLCGALALGALYDILAGAAPIFSDGASARSIFGRFTWAISCCGPWSALCLSSQRWQYSQSDRDHF